ncbi:unnamed protein product [Notodromas monacha]|uniref:Integrator complex subunit 7 n=1 Tax=Notodromas monacha TaxID=399045 RepID=A0A7R9BMZ7_9CRUS|nr:unnamed protein product [Notodromas monacha]CAG0917398.1 unnamed protein product [Notodromas monacha]
MDQLVSHKSSIVTEGDMSLDSNMAMTDLDKGLRSSNVGEQCEAIVRVPRLFENYPFPILINSAVLKLADVFRFGNNFLRMCVLRVCQQSRRHLDKVINVDEFVQRIFSVIHSNDPVARGLTLRLLGSIAVIIPEAKEVHHAIRSALDSHDREELEAAILAAARFTKHSKTFSTNISGKISEMMEGLSHPVEIKIKLLPIFGNMHHDAETALTVRSLCLELLRTYPSVEFKVTTIRTLTRLSIATLVNIPEQVSLLIECLQADHRDEVKLCALSDLRLVAKEAPHLWTQENWKTVVKFAEERRNEPVIFSAVLVLLGLLTESGSLPEFVHDRAMQKLCLEAAATSPVARVGVEGAVVLTTVVTSLLRSGRTDEEFVEDALLAIQDRVFRCLAAPDKNRNSLKRLLCLVVKLASCCDQVCARLVTILTQYLTSDSEVMANAFCGMGSGGCRDALGPVKERVMGLLKDQSVGMSSEVFGTLMTLLFQATSGLAEWNEKLREMIVLRAVSVDPWVLYRIVRQAARYGHFEWASAQCQTLEGHAVKEMTVHWFKSLRYAFVAETELNRAYTICKSNSMDRWDSLSRSIIFYHNALISLKAVGSADVSSYWREEFLKLRTKMLEAHRSFAVAVTGLSTCPPPSNWRKKNGNSPPKSKKSVKESSDASDDVNGDESVNGDDLSGDDFYRYGSAAHQLLKVTSNFRHVASGYEQLIEKSFDADPQTLISISLLNQSCGLMANAVQFAMMRAGARAEDGDGKRIGSSFFIRDAIMDSAALSLEHKIQLESLNACSSALDRLMGTFVKSGDKSFSPRLVAAVLDITSSLFCVPLSFPRFFFQHAQNTAIKLNTSPETNSASFSQSSAPNLAVKIEGVIEHGGKRKPFRRVSQVVVSVKAHVSAGGMTQTLTPKNDYFTAQFLLNTAAMMSGSSNVVIETHIVDEEGRVWDGGVKVLMPLGAMPKFGPGLKLGRALGRSESPQLDKDALSIACDVISMNALPLELLAEIFCRVNFGDLLELRLVSTKFNEAVTYSADRFLYVIADPFLSNPTEIEENVESSAETLKKSSFPFHNFFIKCSNLQSCFQSAKEITLNGVEITSKLAEKILQNASSSLKKLSLEDCNSIFITGQIFRDWTPDQALENLVCLRVSDTRYLSDDIFSRILPLCPNLRSLELERCQISSHGMVHRRFYPAGRDAMLSQSLLSVQTVMRLLSKHCRAMKSLSFCEMALTDDFVEELCGCRAFQDLEELSLNVCPNISERGFLRILQSFPKLKKFSSVKSLRVISGNLVSALGSDLEVLRLGSFASLFTLSGAPDDLISIFNRNPSLHTLVLRSTGTIPLLNASIVADMMEKKMKFFESLTVLDLSECMSESCDIECTLDILGRTRGQHLKELYLSNVPNLTFVALSFVFKYLTKLRLLDLSKSVKLEDDHLFGCPEEGTEPEVVVVPQMCSCNATRSNILSCNLRRNASSTGCSLLNLTELQVLNLSSCGRLTEVGILHGLGHSSLHTLDISCNRMSRGAVKPVAILLPSLRDLIMDGCYGVQNDDIITFVRDARRLKRLSLRGIRELNEFATE